MEWILFMQKVVHIKKYTSRAENFRMGFPYRLINLEINNKRRTSVIWSRDYKKKVGSSIIPDIHHSKVPRSEQLGKWLLSALLIFFFNYSNVFISIYELQYICYTLNIIKESRKANRYLGLWGQLFSEIIVT